VFSVELQQFLNDQSAALSSGYTERKVEVLAVYDAVKRWAARALEQPLKEELGVRPAFAYDDKKQIAHWLNHECRTLGLAVACPKTGKPSLVSVHMSGNPREGEGSFKFESVGDTGQRTCAAYRGTLADIKLVLDSEERAHPAEYRREENQRGRG